MYRYCDKIVFKNLPKDEPLDLYIMKRGALLVAAAVTSDSYQSVYLRVENGIRDVADFTRLCVEHNFQLTKDPAVRKFYNLECTLDMCDDLCTIDEHPCQPAKLPDQLVDCLAG